MGDSDIVLFGLGAAERRILCPVAQSFKRRRKNFRWAKSFEEPARVGVYCSDQKATFAVNSEIPVIIPPEFMHMAEYWPDYWLHQPWDRYDLGLVPSEVWTKMAQKFSKSRNRLPRFGLKVVGWPICEYQSRKKSIRLDEEPRKLLGIFSSNTEEKQRFLQQVLDPVGTKLYLTVPALDSKKTSDICLPQGAERATTTAHCVFREDVLVLSDSPSVVCEALAVGNLAILLVDWWTDNTSFPFWPQDPTRYLPAMTTSDFVTAAREDALGSALHTIRAKELSMIEPAVGNAGEKICDTLIQLDNDDGFLTAERKAFLFVQNTVNEHQSIRAAFENLYSRLPDSIASSTGLSFDETKYLKTYPDVGDAVAKGHIASAVAHWRASGKSEGRKAFFTEGRTKASLVSWQPGIIGDGLTYADALSAQSDRKKSMKSFQTSERIIIYAPPYSNNTGGGMALYELGLQLKAFGVNTSVWVHSGKPNPLAPPDVLNLPLANGCSAEEAIVIYPEVIEGNPLGARNVVRWLLNKPGVIAGPKTYGASDFFVHYSPFCAFRPDPAFELSVLTLPLTSSVEKSGESIIRSSEKCFVRRKGEHLPHIPEVQEWKEISCNSAEEYARTFHRFSMCFSYDTFTYLSIQAALCGAISVVCPQPGLSAGQWRTLSPALQYGVAYGFGEIERAQRTSYLIRSHLANLKKKGRLQVASFIQSLVERGWLSSAAVSPNSFAPSSKG